MEHNATLKPVLPSLDYEAELVDYRREFLNSGDPINGSARLANYENISDWLAWVNSLTSAETLPPDYVVCSTYLYVREEDNKIVGMAQLRHYLNDYTEKYAGHVGYSIRPSERGKHYAMRLLHDMLPRLKSLGHNRILVTCEPQNVASRKVILSNGGVYESTVHDPLRQADLERYWIDLEA